MVVGGGMAGVKLCHHMASTMHNLLITVLSPNDALDISWASPRAIADPKSANRNVVPFNQIFKNGRVVHKQGTAASVSKTAVTTSTGEVRTPFASFVLSSSALLVFVLYTRLVSDAQFFTPFLRFFFF